MDTPVRSVDSIFDELKEALRRISSILDEQIEYEKVARTTVEKVVGDLNGGKGE